MIFGCKLSENTLLSRTSCQQLDVFMYVHKDHRAYSDMLGSATLIDSRTFDTRISFYEVVHQKRMQNLRHFQIFKKYIYPAGQRFKDQKKWTYLGKTSHIAGLLVYMKFQILPRILVREHGMFRRMPNCNTCK